MADDDIPRLQTVYIACTDESLRVALARRVAGLHGRRVIAEGPAERWIAPGIVIAPVADMAPEECRVFQLRGLVPVVLAALPSDMQRATYEASGAVYLPMDLETGALVAALNPAPRALDAPI